jgi:hypothetical protein
MTVAQQLDNVFSRVSGADLSSSQYRITYQDAGGSAQVLANSAGTVPLGVLQNKPTLGAAAAVAGPGCITKCEAGATIDEGDLVTATVGGRGSAAAAGTNAWYVGQAMSPAASGEFFMLLVNVGRGVQ